MSGVSGTASRRATLTLLSALALLSATACGSSDGGGDNDAEQPDVDAARAAFDFDRPSWRLPLDPYTPNLGAQRYFHEKAEAILVADCLEEAGLPGFPVGNVPTGSLESVDLGTLGLSNEGRRLFDAEIAAEFGYHSTLSALRDAGLYGLTPEQQQQAQDFDALIASSPENRSTLEGCSKDVRESELPLVDYQYVEAIEQLASTQAHEAETTQAARAEWAACMEPQGIPDLPEQPEDMPSPSLSTSYGLATTPDQARSDSGPSPEEIEMAVFDAQCRESSGYSEALYRAEVDAQLRQIVGNEDKLERLKESYDADRERVEAILAGFQP